MYDIFTESVWLVELCWQKLMLIFFIGWSSCSSNTSIVYILTMKHNEMKVVLRSGYDNKTNSRSLVWCWFVYACFYLNLCQCAVWALLFRFVGQANKSHLSTRRCLNAFLYSVPHILFAVGLNPLTGRICGSRQRLISNFYQWCLFFHFKATAMIVYYWQLKKTKHNYGI